MILLTNQHNINLGRLQILNKYNKKLNTADFNLLWQAKQWPLKIHLQVAATEEEMAGVTGKVILLIYIIFISIT
jgi:hypothetical protein